MKKTQTIKQSKINQAIKQSDNISTLTHSSIQPLMNTDTLKKIFQSPFNYPIYSREIVHSLFGCNDVLTQPELIDTSSLGDSSHYVGQMEDAEGRLLGFFYTRVAEGSDVRRKRVGLRKLIQPYLRYEVDAAIAVFDDGQHWRLSYICDHKEGTTSAKRFSYVLGDKMGQYKTPLERLDKVAAKAGHFKLEDLKEAFSVDALSKEFFDEYHRHYDHILRTTVELISKDPTLYSGLSKLFADYIKKMMGRIVFLHFLQKKGWLNGDPDFLKNLFFMQPLDRREDFLEQVLEPLFFGIFNTEPQNREKLFRDEGWDVQLLEQWKGLPYLNGGLFERDMMDTAKLKLPASLFERLFDFMASYNFTVDENDPDDADIGVDPEMLGKIFESLLEDNKAKGAFYTPKEIVRYMCKESLITYLGTQATGLSKEPGVKATGLSKEPEVKATSLSKESGVQASSLSKESGVKATSLSKESGVKATGLSDYIRKFVEQHEFPEELEPYREVLDTALRNVKICDPAIGSGAFPMGLLNELWRCREALEERAACLSKMGTQAKGLSQAGSLYSEEGQAGSLNPYSRAALKREIIENNIYGVDIERGAIDIARLRFWLSIVVDAERPEPLPNFDYKFMQGNSLIESFDGHDLSHIMESGSRSLPGRGARRAGWAENQTGMEFGSDEVKQNLRNWLKMYFSLTNHKEKAYYRELINSSVKSYIKQQGIGPAAETRLNAIDPSANKDFFLWHTWFKDIFDNGGFDIVIGNPPYIRRTELPEKVKTIYENKYKSAKLQYDIYLLFIEFGLSICNDGGQLCFINPIRFFSSDYGQICRTLIIENYYLRRVVDVSQIEVFKNALTYPCVLHIQNREFKEYSIEFYSPNSLQVLNEVTKSKFKYLYKKNIIKDPELRIIVSENHNLIGKIDKNGSTIDRWFKVARGLPNNKVDFTGNKYNALKSTMVKKYKIIDTYIRVNTEYSEKFKNEMIILPRTVLFLQATMKEKGIVLLDRIYYLTQKSSVNTRFILGVINSKVTNFWFEHYYGTTKVSGGYFDLNGTQIKSIPIPSATLDKQNDIARIVDEILLRKNQNTNANTTSLEKEIDQQVYALYNLTPEEIAIIEQSAK